VLSDALTNGVNMSNEGKRDRDARLFTQLDGCWGSHHSLMIYVVQEIYQLSRSQARSMSGNTSWFAYAGIPVLVSALQSFVIEYECFLSSDRSCLKPLARSGLGRLVELLATRYHVQGNLLDEANDLIEVRNEMIHPVPLPTGTADNWPRYLRRVKDLGLAQSTGQATDYIFSDQLASHRLFAWSCRVTRDLFQHVASSNREKSLMQQVFVDQLTRIGFESDLALWPAAAMPAAQRNPESD